MSNPNDGKVSDDLSGPVQPAGGWNTVLGTVVMALAGVLLVCCWSGWAEVTPEEPLAESRTVIRWRQSPVFSLAWSPDNRRLAASCFGPVVRVWDRETGVVSSHEGGTEQPRFALGWSDDGQRLMVSGLDLPIESWDLFIDGAEEGAGVVRPLDRSGSTAALIRTTGARSIRLWGPSDRRFGLLTRSGQLANSIAFSADGQSLATGGVEGRLEIHDPSSGNLRRTIEVDSRGITAVTFSPDSSKVATGGPGPVRIWDVASGRNLLKLGDQLGGSATLGFSPDGSRIAVASWDGSIQVWNLSTGTPELRLRGHHGQILSLAWSAGWKTLASGGYDSTVRVWDVPVAGLATASR